MDTPQVWIFIGSLLLAGPPALYLVYRTWRKTARRWRKWRKAARRIPIEQRHEIARRNPAITRHLERMRVRAIIGQANGEDAPRPGDPAPALRLKRLASGNASPKSSSPGDSEPESWIQLSDFAGHKPVALIFGSYT
jgi:hypothetical protein